ncbi:MAG: sigma-70 family RNA polymerase sigma factor [Planctomycetia bacterium]|nr:sigma-70 family RNA polymerase sigma factor [Planctomycetia bacterium]
MHRDRHAADGEPAFPAVSAALSGPLNGAPAPGSLPVPAPEFQHAQLVRDCLASVPGAWDEFVGRFAGLLAHVVDRTAAHQRVALSAGDRDDLVAEILLELLRHDARALRAFAGRASLTTYLTVIGRRVAMRGLDRLRGQAQPPQGDQREAVDARDDVAELATREMVETLLGTLDEAEARIVRMHHLESRSYGEISRLTGMPLGSIGPTLSRARQKLRVLQEPGHQGATGAAGAAMTTAGSARSTGS